MAYTWHAGWLKVPTVVTFTLDPVPEGTRLRLDHSGFQGVRALALSLLLGSGWKGNSLRGSLPRLLDKFERVEADAERVP